MWLTKPDHVGTSKAAPRVNDQCPPPAGRSIPVRSSRFRPAAVVSSPSVMYGRARPAGPARQPGAAASGASPRSDAGRKVRRRTYPAGARRCASCPARRGVGPGWPLRVPHGFDSTLRGAGVGCIDREQDVLGIDQVAGRGGQDHRRVRSAAGGVRGNDQQVHQVAVGAQGGEQVGGLAGEVTEQQDPAVDAHAAGMAVPSRRRRGPVRPCSLIVGCEQIPPARAPPARCADTRSGWQPGCRRCAHRERSGL